MENKIAMRNLSELEKKVAELALHLIEVGEQVPKKYQENFFKGLEEEIKKKVAHYENLSGRSGRNHLMNELRRKISDWPLNIAYSPKDLEPSTFSSQSSIRDALWRIISYDSEEREVYSVGDGLFARLSKSGNKVRVKVPSMKDILEWKDLAVERKGGSPARFYKLSSLNYNHNLYGFAKEKEAQKYLFQLLINLKDKFEEYTKAGNIINNEDLTSILEKEKCMEFFAWDRREYKFYPIREKLLEHGLGLEKVTYNNKIIALYDPSNISKNKD